MVRAFIKYGNNSLVTEFPVEAMRLYNQLSSIGINTPVNKIPALGNADILVEVFPAELLVTEKAVGQSLINRLTSDDTLHDVNVASYWLWESCKENHEAFEALIVQTSPATLAELRDLAKVFHQNSLANPEESHNCGEDQDVDDGLKL